jgi:hypothetical protein
MFAAAAQAGMRDNTHMHGVFDMGKWIHTQYEEKFCGQPRTACADIVHVTEYLSAAGRELEGREAAEEFGSQNKRQLLAGRYDLVLQLLKGHNCTRGCERDENNQCVVLVARRYLTNHRTYLNYPPILARDLPVGSGEAESGIRHIIKKRLDVAGAWREDNAKRMLALISVRASGLWEDFWKWRNRRDIEQWRQRQSGEIRSRFRGTPYRSRSPRCPAAEPAVAADAA